MLQLIESKNQIALNHHFNNDFVNNLPIMGLVGPNLCLLILNNWSQFKDYNNVIINSL